MILALLWRLVFYSTFRPLKHKITVGVKFLFYFIEDHLYTREGKKSLSRTRKFQI